MYYFRDTGADLITFGIVLMLTLIVLAVKAAVFVVQTFLKYYKHKSLWIALGVCVMLSTCALLLALSSGSQGWEVLAYIGIAELLIVCKAVDMRNRDTLMTENPGWTDQVLKRSWWSGDDEPVEALAA